LKYRYCIASVFEQFVSAHYNVQTIVTGFSQVRIDFEQSTSMPIA